MASKAVTNREKNARSVTAAGKTYAEAISKEVGDAVAPFLKPAQKVPDLQQVILLLMRWLTAVCEAMVTADDAHELELSDDAKERDKRDDDAGTLTALLVDLREMALGMFGRTVLRHIGFSGRVPRDPVVLRRYGGEIATKLRKAVLPESRLRGAQLDKGELADDLEATAAKLKAALSAVAREKREAQVTLADKNKAIERFDDLYGGLTLVITGLLILAGEEELADKLLPTARRPSHVDEDDDQAESGSGEAPAPAADAS